MKAGREPWVPKLNGGDVKRRGISLFDWDTSRAILRRIDSGDVRTAMSEILMAFAAVGTLDSRSMTPSVVTRVGVVKLGSLRTFDSSPQH